MTQTTQKKKLKTGDRVSWATGQGKTSGKVISKVSSTTVVKGYKAKATSAHPQYKVKSLKTGAKAVHKAEALKKMS